MAIKRKTRMYEPWGYRDQDNYQGSEIIHENDLNSFFANTKYVKDDNKIYFYNKDGEQRASLDVSEFVKSDSIIEKTEYNDGILKIYFTNGDIITIDLTELLDENEFKDGLIVDGHVVKVLIDSNSDPYLTVSEDGVKLYGVKDEIERLDAKIDQEIADRIADVDEEEARATGEEARIEAKLDQEIADREADVDAEEARAKAAEEVLTTNLANEVTRATQTEQSINHRVDVLNDELDAEESRAQAAEQELRLLITKETADRIADVNEEEARAKAAEQALQDAIDAEEARATSAETTLDEKIAALREALNAEEERAISAETSLDEKITLLREALDAEIDRATEKETELEGADIASGNVASDATISVTKNNGNVITFVSAEQIDLEAGEF